MSKAKPILFVDFDGTICHDRYWSSLEPKHYEQVQELLFRGDTKRVNDWMRGEYSAEEVNEFVADEIGMPYEKLWELFVSDCKSMRVSNETLRRLSDLRQKFTVILITGNMDSFSRFTVPALQLERYFDHISNSYHEGRHKTDDNGSLFLDYTERYGSPIDECKVIDDNEKVCAVFSKLGGTAYQITPETDISYHLDTLEARV